MIIGIFIIIFTVGLYIKLQYKKLKYRDKAFHLWTESMLNGNKDFGQFYMANAGLFYCKVFAPKESARNMPALTIGGILSGISGVVFMFTEGITSPLAIIGIAVAILTMAFSPSVFYCTNISPDLLIENATQNYLSYTNQRLVERQQIVDYCQAAESITVEHLLMLYGPNKRYH